MYFTYYICGLCVQTVMPVVNLLWLTCVQLLIPSVQPPRTLHTTCVHDPGVTGPAACH